MSNFTFEHQIPLRSSWNSTRMLIRGPLTDRKIAKYQKEGYYSEAFREARRELWARKAKRRDGSFLRDGQRLIYSPL